MSLLANKRALVFGLSNRYSLAYHIAKAMKVAGADIALSYHSAMRAEKIQRLSKELGASFFESCDVSQDLSIANFFEQLTHHWNTCDIIVHAIAYAPSTSLQGEYLTHTSRTDFHIAHDITSYSFTAIAKQAQTLLTAQGALLTLSYLGAERAVPSYNVMGLAKASLEASVRYLAQSLGPRGVRVNAISAGPIRTTAASGIEAFQQLKSQQQARAPLRNMLTPEHVARAAVCLCSDWMSGVTGEVLHVDNGFHAISPLTT